LFATTPGFILLTDAPTLLDWFKNNAAIQAGPVAPPIPQPGASYMINNVNSTKISMTIYKDLQLPPSHERIYGMSGWGSS
jgi:hypothetical protein